MQKVINLKSPALMYLSNIPTGNKTIGFWLTIIFFIGFKSEVPGVKARESWPLMCFEKNKMCVITLLVCCLISLSKGLRMQLRGSNFQIERGETPLSSPPPEMCYTHRRQSTTHILVSLNINCLLLYLFYLLL